METIVITGSTRGIGLGIARELLRLGRSVVINGRQDGAVRAQVDALAKEFPAAKVVGYAADVTSFPQLQGLWDFAVRHFGRVDIWINNAGVMNTHHRTWDVEPENLRQVIDINLLGTLYGCKVAIAGMARAGGGYVYNFEGFGSNGRQFHPSMTPYGCTKVAVRYLTRALQREARGSNVKIGAISPGIVVTDLLRDPYAGKPKEWEAAKKIFNILGDHVETVAPYIAARVLKGTKSGETIAWLTFGRVLARFLGAMVSKRDLFAAAPSQVGNH